VPFGPNEVPVQALKFPLSKPSLKIVVARAGLINCVKTEKLAKTRRKIVRAVRRVFLLGSLCAGWHALGFI
jgi:hypothetical protein